jgi:hypothetical protein
MSTNIVSNKASGSVTDYTVQDVLGIQSEVAVVRGSFVMPTGTASFYKYFDQAFTPSTPLIACYGSSPIASGVSSPLVTIIPTAGGSANFFIGTSANTTAPLTVNYYIA